MLSAIATVLWMTGLTEDYDRDAGYWFEAAARIFIDLENGNVRFG
jgi:hypothetical protein